MPWSSAEKSREWNKAYYEKNKEVINAKRKERYRLANPPKPKKPKRTDEERVAYAKEYYKNNREKLLAQAKAKREADPKHAEYSKEYYKNNKERIEANKKKWAAKNKEKIRQYTYAQQRKAFEENPDKVRATRRARKAALKAKDPQLYNMKVNQWNRKQYAKSVGELWDCYIRQLLCKHPVVKRLLPEEIPQELVEVKRLEIQIRRLLNEKRK